MIGSKVTIKQCIVALLAVAGFSAVFSLAVVSPSYARQSSNNGAERYVESGGRINQDGRYIGPTCADAAYNIGTIWVTNSSGTSEDVVVTGGANTVNIRIYSSVRACSEAFRRMNTYSSLAHLSQCNGWIPMTLIPQGSTRYLFHAYNDSWGQWENTRYYIPERNRSAGHWWSDPFQGGNYINATIDIRGYGTGNYSICLRGSFSDSTCRAGTCYASNRQIGFRVIRQYRWTLTPSSTITSSASTNRPGQTLTWQHSLRNNGPDNMDRNATYSGQNQGSLGSGNAGSWSTRLNNGQTTQQNTSRLITQGDVGNNLCRRTTVAPVAWNNNGTSASGNACRSIPYNYSLSSTITNVPDVVEAGQAVTGLSGTVVNNGPTKTYPTDVRYVRVIYPSGTSVSTRSGTSGDNTCDYYGAPTSRCNEMRTGTGANDRTNYVFNHPNGDSGGAITSSNGTYTMPSINNSLSDELDVGDRVCYGLVVRGHNAATGQSKSASYYSQLQCSVVGKKPKVQVHGNGVSVGRMFGGSADDEYNSSARVETTLTNKESRTETVPAPEGSISGLWRTGVDNSNSKVASDQDDDHWQIDRAYRYNGDSQPTCARAHTSSGNVISIPSSSSGVVIPARTVIENVGGSTGTAGMYSGANSIVGQAGGAADGSPVWYRQANNARWISHNLYGQNYSTSSCTDPSTGGGTALQQLGRSNVYVYKLRNPINVASDVNLNSIRLTIGGAVDNLVKFYVNGCELRATHPRNTAFGDGRWQEPGWSPSAQAGAEAYVTGGGAGCSTGSTGFRHGNNTFELHVLSTYSHTGILIDRFDASATVTRSAANVFGSWAEYGIFAPGEIRWMASGSGLEGGVSSNLQADWSRLTFTHAANAAPACTALAYGCYSHGRVTLPSVSSAFPVTGSTPQVSGPLSPMDMAGSTSDGRVVTTSQSVLRITAGELTERRWAVLNAPNTHVIIEGDLTYDDGPFSRPTQIPQLLIIARDITINSNVGRVDAWLIATNAISTCNQRSNGATQISAHYATTRLVADDCDRILTVNGPVIAEKLYLRRTGGSRPATSGNPTGPGEPAEIFNLRPDAYLWAGARMGNNRIYVTTGLQELPPRY